MTTENQFARALVPLKKVWMAFARLLGWCTTNLLLTLFFALLGFPALFMKLFGRSSLKRPLGRETSYWKDKEQTPHTLERARHQF